MITAADRLCEVFIFIVCNHKLRASEHTRERDNLKNLILFFVFVFVLV